MRFIVHTGGGVVLYYDHTQHTGAYQHRHSQPGLRWDADELYSHITHALNHVVLYQD